MDGWTRSGLVFPIGGCLIGFGAVAARLVRDSDGQEWKLGESCVIGRSPSADIQLDDVSISREHAMIRLGEGGYLLYDLDSANGCRVNGAVVSQPVTLHHGDTVVVADVAMRFQGEGEETERLLVAGEGEAGMAGAGAGDLYVEVRVRPHRIFERDGDDLFCEVPIPFTLAALGGELDIPTLGGQVKLKIPAETQSGRMFRLKGKGVQSVRSHRSGDLMCRVAVETPVKLSKEQKDLLQQFEKSFTADNRSHNPRTDSWLSSVKDFFERMTS